MSLLALAGCGGTAAGNGVASAGHGKGSGTPSAAVRSSTDPQEAQLKYARCLREHGVNMPDDPKDLPSGGLAISDTAEKACKKWMQGVGTVLDANDPQTRDRFLKLARCMRAHGIDWPDPQPGSLGGPPPDYDGGDNKPKFDQALKACRQGGR
jgi:hypothetical protein